MHISNVEIRNFRALQSVSIPLNRFSVLIGENDVGKTTFLHALDKFFAGKKLTEENDWFRDDTTKDIRIVVTFAGAPESEELKPYLRTDGTIILSKVFSYGKAPDAHAIMDDNSAASVQKKVLDAWFSSDNFHFVPVRRDLAVQFSMTKTALLGKTLRASMKKALDEGGGAAAIKDLQETLGAALDSPREELEHYLQQQMHNESVRLGFADLDIDPVEGVTFNVKLSDDRVENILIQNRGAGTQNNLIIALFRLIADLDIGGYFIFAMEEPENSLHPKAQRQLLSVIQDIGEKSQVIVTTHSPVFIDRSKFENNILMTRTPNGNTVGKAFNPALLTDIRTDLGIRASDALLKGGGNCALLVEGSTEENGFPVLMEMQGLSEFEMGIAIINMGGSDFQKVRSIAQLLQAYDIPCVIVLDNDTAQTKEDLDRAKDAGLNNIREVVRLSKGTIEDYYPLSIVAQIINEHLCPDTPVSSDMFDESKHGKQRLNDFRRVMHENGAGDSVEYLKTLLGSEGTKALKDGGYEVDGELAAVFEKVQSVVTER